MTREERKKAIEVLDDMKVKIDIPKAAKAQNDRNWALDVAIQALSQEPCTDAVSRQAVLDAMYELCDTGETLKENPWRDNPHIDAITDAIEDLPPVTQKSETVTEFADRCRECGARFGKLLKQKSGKWIDYRDDGFVECPFCGHATNCEDDIDELHYCFYCGARMIEPQESREDELKDLSKRVETLEKQMKEDGEEQLKKLKAELDYAKFRCAL